MQHYKTLDKLFNVNKEKVLLLCGEGEPLKCQFSHLKGGGGVDGYKATEFLAFIHSSRISPVDDNDFQPEDNDQIVLVEVEPILDSINPKEAPVEEDGAVNIQEVDSVLFHTNTFSLHLASADSVEELGMIIAREVQRVSGYDRVMIYAFDQGT